MSPDEAPKTEPAEPTGPHTIILRPWPKVIFFYPTMLGAFIMGAWQLIEGAGPSEQVGLAFFAVLALNLLVISFEFSRIITLSLGFLLLAAVFFVLWLGNQWPVVERIRELLAALHLQASSSFYLAVGSYLFLIFVGVFINTRWNFWEVRHNEIVHRTGFLGDIRRFPSPNLKMTKEISDVLEHLLLGSGRIILYPASEKEAIVLDNVLNVNRVERELKTMLSVIQVEMSKHRHENYEN